MKITNATVYKQALNQIDIYMTQNPVRLTKRFDDLVAAVVEYEERLYPKVAPDPVEAIKFRMDQFGHSQAEVCRMTGLGKTHFSEVLCRKRKLNLDQIRKLNRYGIALEVLVREYKL